MLWELSCEYAEPRVALLTSEGREENKRGGVWPSGVKAGWVVRDDNGDALDVG